MQKFLRVAAGLFLGWAGIAAADAAPVQSAFFERSGSGKLAPNDSIQLDINFPMYPGAAGTLRRVRVSAGFSLKASTPYRCDDPASGIQGTCDNNGVSISGIVNIFGNIVSDSRANFDICEGPSCGGPGDLGFGYFGKRLDLEFFGADAEAIFSGPGFLAINDIVEASTNFAPFCASGSCDIQPLPGGRYVGNMFAKVVYEFEPIPYVRSMPNAEIAHLLQGFYVTEPGTILVVSVPLALVIVARLRRSFA